MYYEMTASYFYTGAAFLHWGFVSPEDLPLKKTPSQPIKINSIQSMFADSMWSMWQMWKKEEFLFHIPLFLLSSTNFNKSQ